MPEVLLIDQCAAVVDMLNVSLEQEGVRTDSASNGEDALRKLCARTVSDSLYDAVVLDMRMAAMSAWQVLKAIKSNPLWRSMEVVVLTGTADAPEDLCTVIDYDAVFVNIDLCRSEMLGQLVNRLSTSFGEYEQDSTAAEAERELIAERIRGIR